MRAGALVRGGVLSVSFFGFDFFFFFFFLRPPRALFIFTGFAVFRRGDFSLVLRCVGVLESELGDFPEFDHPQLPPLFFAVG